MTSLHPYAIATSHGLTMVMLQGESDIEQLCKVLQCFGTPNEQNWPVSPIPHATKYCVIQFTLSYHIVATCITLLLMELLTTTLVSTTNTTISTTISTSNYYCTLVATTTITPFTATSHTGQY